MQRILETHTRVSHAGSHMNVLTAGSGEPVVLAHSYLWDAEMWRPQIDALAPHYAVVVPELWGHGASGELPGGTTSLRDLALQHLAIFDRLGLKRFTLVGLSVGAMWAAELALIAPERIRGLVLMDSFLGPEPAARRDQFSGMLDMVEATGAPSPQLLDGLVPFFLSPRARQEQPKLVQRFRQSMYGWDPVHLVHTVVPLGRMIFGRRDALLELADLGIPALVMTGGADISRPPEEGRQMARTIDCPFVEIPGAGHIASLERPDFVTGQLGTFLAHLHGRGNDSGDRVTRRQPHGSEAAS